jgi:hypothetical protein
MSEYEEQLSTIQSNLDAVLAMEPQAKQTQAACDDLIAKLPDMFAVQAGTSAGFGFVPVPDPDDYSKMDSNLRYLSASIEMVFTDAHSAKTVIDKAVWEAKSFSAKVSKIWRDEFGEQLSARTKAARAKGTAKPQHPPSKPPATTAAPQQGPQLLPTPGPVQQEQHWEPLPGAPSPSPYREVETKKATFAKMALDLKARGDRIIHSSPPDTAGAELFKKEEQSWRQVVDSWLKHYKNKGPETGVRAMEELLESDQYGGGLRLIRQSLGG